MKKIISILLALAMMACGLTMLASCGDGNKIIVQTNAFFAPFEYYEGTEIKGVDVEIMNMVGEKMGKKVEFVNVEFSAIIDNVKAGEVCDAGAAGITITDERKDKVDFSIPYYTSVQYVIVPKGTFTAEDLVDGKLSVSKLATLEKNGIGVQSGTTGSFLIGDAIDLEEGELYGSGKQMFEYKDAIVASQDIGSTVGAVIIDKLPAQQISGASENLECFELDAEPESYVLYLNKEATELLTQINGVLQTLIDNGTIAQYTINHSSGNN